MERLPCGSMSHMAPTTDAPTFTIMMGLPAAGKSTTANGLFGDHQFIDCDAIKATHPDYDPKNPQALHAWSKGVEAGLLDAAFDNVSGNVLYDTTGTNEKKLRTLIAKAGEAGYRTRICFVTCFIETSLYRNSLRPRVVPEFVIREKADIINSVAANVRGLPTEFLMVENNENDNSLIGQ